MSEPQAWQVSSDAARVYERDFVPALFQSWPPVLADAAGLRPGQRVLDIGCGTGIASREAARRVGPAGSVTGLDINHGMLAVAREQAPEIAWRHGDAGALPFADASFDVVISQFALMFFPDRAAALREMWRVLAPGGTLALLVWAPIETAPAEATLCDILRRRVGETAAEMLDAPFVLGDPARLLPLFDAAGIAAPRVRDHDGEARFASLEEFIRIEIKATPLAEVVDDAAYATVLADARAQLIPYANGGGFRFPVQVRAVSAAKP